MRYLSKIIFINSAHIRYSEIRLDGNVHFTGTQGVGKSTILRALLFFYNADKQHLGIKAEQKSFDQFYFENANSYILYEVEREIGAYTIFVSRHQGRAVFRFIDAPYTKEWLINDAGEVLSDWVKIRQNIQQISNVVPSERIDSGEKYRDIIFGNTHERGNKYAKYAIVESTKYQNIPRSIQNVFLNSKLDAEFVKKTIIESMTDSDTEETIKLSVYRSLVKDFEQEYNDIALWYKQDKNGEILLRRQAQQVINAYRETIAFEQQIRRSIRELNYAVQKAQEQLPVAQEDLRQTDELIQKENQKKKDVETEFQKERKSIDQLIGEKNGKLKDIRSKRKEYADINIEAMICRNQAEPNLRSERSRQQDLLDALTRQYSDIEAKYKILLGTLENSFTAFKNQQTEQLNKLRNDVQLKKDKHDKERRELIDAAEKRYNELRDAIDVQLEALQEDKNKAENKLKELRIWQPYAQEKETLQNEIQQLSIEEKECGANKQAKEEEIKRLRAEAQKTEADIINNYNLQDERLQQQQRQLQDQLDKINSLLERYSGSLYEWLTQNKPQWEDTIGRIADEERVLYAQGLSPQLLSEDDTLFGVAIDLSQVEPTHRSPDEYKAQSKELQEQIEAVKNERTNLYNTKEQDLKKNSDKLSANIKDLNQEITNYRVRLNQIPQLKKDKQTQIDSYLRKEDEERKIETDKQQEILDGIVLKISQTKFDKKAKQDIFEKEKKSINSAFESKVKALKAQLDQLKSDQAEELKNEEEKYNKQKLQHEQEREAELKGKGADTKAIQQLKEAILTLDNELKQIDEERKYVILYQKDKEELFDKEETIKQDKKVLEEKIENLQKRYDDKKGRITSKISELNQKRESLSRKIAEWEDGLKQYKQIVEIEHLLTDEYLQDEKATQTTKSCQLVISELRGAINDKKRRQEDLKRYINSFNSHFSSQNTFHFNTLPQSEEDFDNIAQSLQEFIDNDKIEEYSKRTSEHYQNILQGVSREVGNLMNHQSEIEAVIRDINRDFIEKNFAGVIKSIELRAEPSDDSMMRLLQRIKEFSDENSFNMGATNLFSDNNKEEVNKRVVDYLIRFMQQLQKEPNKQQLTLSDTFNLQFRVKENDHSTGWVERINNVGSDGTDILVKAMINIMLINVFKNKASRNKNQEFVIHCMMDEIGKLHPTNVKGILQFANERNIYLVNSSPMSYNAYDYKYTYLLSKDTKSMTKIVPLLKNVDQ